NGDAAGLQLAPCERKDGEAEACRADSRRSGVGLARGDGDVVDLEREPAKTVERDADIADRHREAVAGKSCDRVLRLDAQPRVAEAGDDDAEAERKGEADAGDDAERDPAGFSRQAGKPGVAGKRNGRRQGVEGCDVAA